MRYFILFFGFVFHFKYAYTHIFRWNKEPELLRYMYVACMLLCWRFWSVFVTQERRKKTEKFSEVICSFWKFYARLHGRERNFSCVYSLSVICVCMVFMRILHVPSFNIFLRITTKNEKNFNSIWLLLLMLLHSNFFLNHKFFFLSFVSFVFLYFICFLVGFCCCCCLKWNWK